VVHDHAVTLQHDAHAPIAEPAAPDRLGFDTNQLTGPALRNLVIPHHAERRVTPLGARLAASDFSRQILRDSVVEHAVGQQPLELTVLVFERAQATGVRNLKPAVFSPCLRQTSTVGSPASCSSIIPISYASVKRLFLICLLLPRGQALHQIEGSTGGWVSRNRTFRRYVAEKCNLRIRLSESFG